MMSLAQEAYEEGSNRETLTAGDRHNHRNSATDLSPFLYINPPTEVNVLIGADCARKSEYSSRPDKVIGLRNPALPVHSARLELGCTRRDCTFVFGELPGYSWRDSDQRRNPWCAAKNCTRHGESSRYRYEFCLNSILKARVV